MAAAKSVTKEEIKEEFKVAHEFWRTRSRDGKDDHLKVGDPYTPVNDEEKQIYLDRGLIVPADAGSGSSGDTNEGESA